MNPILAIAGLFAAGLVALVAGGKKRQQCDRVVLDVDIATRVAGDMPELMAGITMSTPAIEIPRRILQSAFPDCEFDDGATTIVADTVGAEQSWQDIRKKLAGKTIGDVDPNDAPFMLEGAVITPSQIDSLFATALTYIGGIGKETASQPQGYGSYVGDPKGFTSWPGQAILQTQRAIGEALMDMGYETGDWKSLSYSVISDPTFTSIKKWQADTAKFRAHYGANAAWMPALTPDGLLGNAGMTALSQIVERNINWPDAIAKIPASVKPTPSTGGSAKVRLWNMLRALTELTEDQRLFIMLVAYGETGASFRPTAHNDTPSEVAASQAAWDNNPTLATKLLACGYPEEQWAIGSGGYGGRLVPYFGNDMIRASLTCRPDLVFEAKHSLLSALITAYYMQQTNQWKGSAKTVKNLRAGYYGLGYIRNQPADRIAKYKKHAVAVGLPESFVDRVLPTFPSPSKAKAMLAKLQAVA